MRDKPQIKKAGVNMKVEAHPEGTLSIFVERKENADTIQNIRSPICSVLSGHLFFMIHTIDITATIP